MRRLIVSSCLALAGCRGLLGIDDPIIGGNPDASPDTLGAPDAPVCSGDDWDADGVPDACDLCPMLATNEPDSDADLIGDGCDPHPTQGGDLRLLWNGFSQPTSIALWSSSGGTWMITNGQLEQLDPTAVGRIAIPGIRSNVYIRVMASLNTVGTNPYAGVCAYVNAGYKCCDIAFDQAAPGVPSLMSWTDTQTIVNALAGSLGPGNPFVLAETAFDDRHECRLTVGALTPVSAVVPASHPTGQIVLHMARAAVTYHYVWIVQTKP